MAPGRKESRMRQGGRQGGRKEEGGQWKEQVFLGLNLMVFLDWISLCFVQKI